MLTVIRRGPDYEYKGGKNTRWYCTCDHDKYYDEEHTKERPFEERQLFLIRAKSLKRNGGAKSCGCLTRFKKTHGLSKDPLYSRHRGMMRRCKKGKNPHPNYAGRGIEVCEEWANKENGVVNFWKWAHENGYEKRLTIDRIDNDGNYSPENCRWATNKTQSNNKRTNHRLNLNGESHTIAECGDITGLGATVIYKRIEKGWSEERALTTPVEKYKYYLNIDGKDYTITQCSLMTGINPTALYERLHSATKEGIELTDEVIHNIVFTPPKNTGCMNGVYFVDDDGYPTKPPEKSFIRGVTFMSDEEVEEYKKTHPNLFS